MSEILIVLLPYVLLAAGAWLLVMRMDAYAERRRPSEIVIGRTSKDGAVLAMHADLIRARWLELSTREPLPTMQAGAVDVPHAPLELFAARPDEPTPLDLKVQGVDVGLLVGALRSMTEPASWKIETDVFDVSTRVVARVELELGSRSMGVWQVERGKSKADAASTAAEDQTALDAALFEMIHALGTAKPDSPLQAWPAALSLPHDLPSGAALHSYYDGRLRFRRYYETGDSTHLGGAVDALRRLRSVAPHHSDGLLLLGIALMEARDESETEARQAFERYIKLVEQPDPDAAWKKAAEARLLRATASMRQYTWRANHVAMQELLELAHALRGRHGSQADELRAFVHVQLAHGYALYLAHLRSTRLIDVLSDASTPSSIRVSDVDRDASRAHSDQGFYAPERQLVFNRVKLIWDEHNQHLRDAELLAKGIADPARADALRFNALLTSGLAFYRAASWIHESDPSLGPSLGVDFARAWGNAREKLEQAEALNPGHYLALQYLGLVHKDPRHRERVPHEAGPHLHMAIAYLERATAVNPKDYYGHEQLAHARLLFALQRGRVPEALKVVDQGIESALRAGERRTWGVEPPLLLAALHQLKHEFSSANARESLSSLDQYVDQAAGARKGLYAGLDPETEWVRLLVEVRRFGKEAAALTDARRRLDEFVIARERLADRLNGLVARCTALEARWVNREGVHRVHHIGVRAEALRQAVMASTVLDWNAIQLPTVAYD